MELEIRHFSFTESKVLQFPREGHWRDIIGERHFSSGLYCAALLLSPHSYHMAASSVWKHPVLLCPSYLSRPHSPWVSSQPWPQSSDHLTVALPAGHTSYPLGLMLLCWWAGFQYPNTFCVLVCRPGHISPRGVLLACRPWLLFLPAGFSLPAPQKGISCLLGDYGPAPAQAAH